LGFTKLVRDSTKSHLALEELSDSEQQLRLLIESVKDYAIFSLALDGEIKNWNAGAEKVFGYKHDEIIGSNFSVLFSADDIAAGIPAAELRRATTHGFTEVERWLVRKDGSRFLASGKLSQLKRDAAGELRGFVKIAHDVTRNHAAAQDLRHQAQFDELTELPNRRQFYGHVQHAIALMKRHTSNLFAVLFIDVDHFKLVNDEYGHIVADELLAVTARRLERCMRSVDVVARIGGDEFAIVLNGISGLPDAIEAANRIGIEMRLPVTIDKQEVRATASIGIAIGSETYDLPEDILRDADAAMYVAKTVGRARSIVFDSSMATDGRGNFDFAAEIRHAIDSRELGSVALRDFHQKQLLSVKRKPL
jgi:diguanylate cyclase (GGDEF)-like protein/PAS domain S-box-containing protein